MQHVVRFGLASVAFVLASALVAHSQSRAAPDTRAGAACTPLTPAQMFLDPLLIPESPFYPVTSFPHLPATLYVPAAGDPVLALRISPPIMLSPLDAYLPGLDYSACIDLGAGSGQVNFFADGAYVVRVERLSSAFTVHIIEVRTKSLGACFKSGAIMEFTCPTPPKAFEGDDADDPPDFENQCTVTSIADLTRKVAMAAGAGMIDLVLVDHGCEGSISVNGQKVSCDPADAANLAAFCQLTGRIRSLTLLSCSTAHGAAGCAFLRKLSRKFGGICVTGYTGNVSSWNRRGRRVWGSYGQAKKVQEAPFHRSPPPLGSADGDLALFFTTSHLPRSLGAIVAATHRLRVH